MRRLIFRLFRRRKLERDLDDELAFHDEMSRLNSNSIQLGNPVRVKEAARDVWRWQLVEDSWRDAIQGMRRLRRSPAFAIASVLTLALAIGANAAIFSVVYGVVLKPLPYPDSDRLINLDHGAALINVPAGMGMKAGLYYYYSDRARTLDGISIFTMGAATLTGDGEPERITITRTTSTLASVLGVPPAAGRWLKEEDERPGSPGVGVISHGLWMRRYGGAGDILGRVMTLNGVPTTIVGVMPAGYAFPDSRVDIWLAESLSRASGLGVWTHNGVARLRDGVTIDDVRAEINGLIRDVPRVFSTDPLAGATSVRTGVMSTARSLKETMVGNVAATLWILLAAVGVVLLVACANVANLFLVHAETRQHEMAVRRALGAAGGTIARLFMTESLLLSMAGGLAGLGLAWAAVRALVAAAPANLPRLGEIRLDGAVVAFTFALSMLAALVFGSMPMWRRARLAPAIGEYGRRNTASPGRHRIRQLLMGGQVALALILLVSAGLMVRSFWKLRAIDPGFNATSALTFTVGLPPRDYATRDEAVRAHRLILDQLAALPGVSATSASTCLPLSGPCFGNGVVVDGRDVPDDMRDGNTGFRAVAGDYFKALGIPLLRGRGIEPGVVERREPIAVVDERFADLLFTNMDPIGQRVTWSHPPQPGQPMTYTWLTIVGIVGNTPVRTLSEAAPMPQLYMPMSATGQFDAPAWEYIGPRVGTMNYVVRSTTLQGGLLSSVRNAINTIDPDLALAQVSTLEERLDRASAPMAFTMMLLVIAAAVAVMLGLIGIYGVVSYIVSHRTNEIGVRLALGAEPRGVTTMIVRQGGLITLAGIAVGLAGAVAAGRFIESLLYGVSPHDPMVFAVTALTLFGIAILACWIPAFRAARLNPADALRPD